MPSPQDMMQIGNQLVQFCNDGRETECLNQLYTEDAVSAEAMAMPGQESNETKGLDGIRGKHNWWNTAHEIHSTSAQGPFVHGDDKFAVIFEMDVTNKESGERVQMKEVAQYFVNEAGKIHREEFSYALG